MANKYVSHGNTYCGDGTTSDAASVDGGVGAWNNLRDVARKVPAYGSVDDGDVIYVRTLLNGSAITLSYAETLAFSAGGSSSAPITYIFDDGTIWGESGVIEWTCNGNYPYSIGNYLQIYGGKRIKFIMNHNSATGSLNNLTISYVEGLIVYYTNTGSGINLKFQTNLGMYDNCEFYVRGTYSNGTPIFNTPNYGSQHLINCLFDFTSCQSEVVFPGGGTYGSFTRVIGGKVIPTTPTQRLGNYTSSYGSGLMITGLDFPKEMLYYVGGSDGSKTFLSEFMASNMPSRPFDFYRQLGNGVVDYIYGDNYPYYNAILPDGNETGWSFRVTGGSAAKIPLPLPLPIIQKWYNQASAQKYLKIEFLVNSAFPLPELGHLRVAFSYINSDGEQKSCAAYKAESSTAAWSATVYGAQTYTKYKLVAQTPDAIKQNTMITAQVLVGYPPTNVGDFMFVDPDIGIS